LRRLPLDRRLLLLVVPATASLALGACVAVSTLAPKEISIPGALYGWAEMRAGQFFAAEAKFREAVAYCRGKGDPRCEMTNTINLSAVQLRLGKIDDARQSATRAAAAARQLDLPQFEMHALLNLAGAEFLLFRFDAAHEHARKASDLADRQEEESPRTRITRGIARAVESRALLAQGNPGAALAEAQEAEAVLRQTRYHGFQDEVLAEHLVGLATVWRLLGDCGRSIELNEEALRLLPQPLDLLRAYAYLGLARCSAKERNQRQELEQLRRAQGDLQSWQARTDGSRSPVARDLKALLDAALYEAERNLDPQAALTRDRTAYGFALLRQLDGENAEALKALLAVPASSEDFDRAQELAAALRGRIRIVEGGALTLRMSPSLNAATVTTVKSGTWVEVLGESGRWTKLRVLEWTGFADMSPGRTWLREADARGPALATGDG
jgi:hypothetical protein